MLTRCALKNWGLGPELGGAAGARDFARGVAHPGFCDRLVAYENGDGAIVMTNRDDGGSLARELIRTIVQEFDWADFKPLDRTVVPVSSADIDELLGTYSTGC
jgi:hypothetical protein